MATLPKPTSNRKASRAAGTKPLGNGSLTITLPKLNIGIMEIPIIGDSPLIVHKWSEKAKQQIRAKQAKLPNLGRDVRDPIQEFKDSMYVQDDGTYAFPAIAFKNAAVDACSHVDGITKVLARGAFHVVGEFVRIYTLDQPEMREDTVRIGMGVGDLRYRGAFNRWAALVTIRFNQNVLTESQIVNLLNLSGFAIGVAEWRPEKNGAFGMYHVAVSSDEFAPFRKSNANIKNLRLDPKWEQWSKQVAEANKASKVKGKATKKAKEPEAEATT